MTSQISRADLESEIWQIAGRTSPWNVERVLRLIDRYVIESAKKWSIQYPAAPEIQDDGWPDLKPGESDLAFEVTRCVACYRVKRWAQFYRDKTRTTGHRNRCMKCCKTGQGEDELAPNITFSCLACGLTKKAGDFYRNAETKTGYDYRCKSCKDGAKQARIWHCKLCGDKKPQWAFPPGKAEEPRSNWACLECWPEGTRLPPKARRNYKCRDCGKEKSVAEFPEGKKENPGAVQFCTECDARHIYRTPRHESLL